MESDRRLTVSRREAPPVEAAAVVVDVVEKLSTLILDQHDVCMKIYNNRMMKQDDLVILPTISAAILNGSVLVDGRIECWAKGEGVVMTVPAGGRTDVMNELYFENSFTRQLQLESNPPPWWNDSSLVIRTTTPCRRRNRTTVQHSNKRSN